MKRRSPSTVLIRKIGETFATIAFFGLVLVVATGVTAGVTMLGAPLAGDPPLGMMPVEQAIDEGATP